MAQGVDGGVVVRQGAGAQGCAVVGEALLASVGVGEALLASVEVGEALLVGVGVGAQVGADGSGVDVGAGGVVEGT